MSRHKSGRLDHDRRSRAEAALNRVAREIGLPLVTWGLEQRELVTGIVDVFAPES